MEYEELDRLVLDYFGDTQARTAGQTKADLLVLAEHCRELAHTIKDEPDYTERNTHG